MPAETELAKLIAKVEKSEIDAAKNHWVNSQSAQDSITRFDSLSKGWDRLSSEIFLDTDTISYRFKKLTGLCTSVVWSQSIDDLLFEVDGPIRNDLERLESEAQADFDRAKRNLQRHRKHQLDDQSLMESIGTLLWTIRSNSMHGRKTVSGPIGPTNRDEQICELGAVVLMDLYKSAFPAW
jgi:hypothetical protein